jgi:hypothetical protein
MDEKFLVIDCGFGVTITVRRVAGGQFRVVVEELDLQGHRRAVGATLRPSACEALAQAFLALAEVVPERHPPRQVPACRCGAQAARSG